MQEFVSGTDCKERSIHGEAEEDQKEMEIGAASKGTVSLSNAAQTEHEHGHKEQIAVKPPVRARQSEAAREGVEGNEEREEQVVR